MRSKAVFFLLLVVAPVLSLAARLIQPGDVIAVTCEEEASLTRSYTITKEGFALINFIGAVQVAGDTVEEAAARISKELVNQSSFPTATIRVTFADENLRPIRISGAVSVVGEIPYAKDLRLQDVLKTAQPLLTANLSAVEIKGVDGRILTIDTAKYDGKDMVFNPIIMAGDSVFVPIQMRQADIYVFGGVEKPGIVVFARGLNLSAVIEKVGGFGALGDRAKIRLERTGKPVMRLDLTKPADDVTIEAGDRIVVELLPVRRYLLIDGEILRPGQIEFRDGMTLTQAIHAAGGLKGDPKSTKVIVMTGEGKQAKRTVYDLGRILEGYVGDVKLTIGDKVLVGRVGRS